ncbi:hypothetical protein ACTWP6_10435 [Mycobacterium sp. 4D054]|uniref:hypothetical protein n=1 Tax=Mycobacterium sp. 4D054 TaxID=3457440 RepID=UPI003FCF23BF
MSNCANGCARCPIEITSVPVDLVSPEVGHDVPPSPPPRRGPYPNVKESRGKKGRWEATHPVRPKRCLGTFDSPEAARYAVLIAQAEHLEAEAEAL